jgi:hypothetical protein
MTVFTAVSSACIESLALSGIETVFGGTDRVHLELQQTAISAAEYIVNDYDWPKLKKLATITGDGTTTAFDLPSDYSRQLVKAQLWSNRLSAPLRHVESDDEWLGLLTIGEFTTYGSWILYADQIHIRPAPADGEEIKYFYITNQTVVDAASELKTAFTADTDTFKLSETLLKLGVVWQFKASKGLQYAEDLATYEREKEKAIVRAAGSKMLRVGQARMPIGVELAYPFAVGT